jgi:hypothetical protein
MPASVGIGITGTLYLANIIAIAAQQLDAKLIPTAMGYVVSYTKPPVTNGNICCIHRDSKILAYAISTIAIATQVSAVASRMGIGRINNLIATTGFFLP